MQFLAYRLSALALAIAAAGAHADTFNRVASFPVSHNLTAENPLQETSAEIITATADGQILAYSDSPRGGLGFIDIRQPDQPKPAGFVSLSGEPTSVSALGNQVVAGVNTSASYVEPSGFLVLVSPQSQEVLSRCDLGGQPDSVAVSKDQRFVAVAIENERDEDLNDGQIPQLPAGSLIIVPVKQGMLDCAGLKRVDLTGLSTIAPTDPEPEFVDFNGLGEVVVTLQENNHLVIVDAVSGTVINHFSAGSVDLEKIDTRKDGALIFTESQQGVAREPDAVRWLDDDRFVIANEGDYQGGARGFSIFHKDGTLQFESGAAFEHEVIRAGHYPDKRSGKKGAEPEGLEVARFGDQTYIFVLSERGSVIGVYRDTGAAPEFMQLLPSGIAPESAVAIPERGLLISANEKDLIEDGGPRAHVMLFSLTQGEAQYPQLVSDNDTADTPIGWGALSGLTADPKTPGILYAVNDSYYKMQPRIFRIDANQHPARITATTDITRDGKVAKKLDLEGIAADGKGGFWLASEGNAKKDVPHALHHVNADGEITRTIALPESLLQHQTRFGAEGIALAGDTLWVAIQRPWGDDPEHHTKLLAYNLTSEAWSAVHYPLEQTTEGWVGLSELELHDDHLYVIERDNRIGEQASIKRLYKVALSALEPKPLGETLPVVSKTLVRDLIPDLQSLHGYVTDKVEGFAMDAQGNGFLVTDNDGVDDSSGETLWLKLGQL
ncbi:phytase-like protein with esterase activity [Marinobacterium halophilum]|uniref:Phytase-like protein with esterase activity n=1 Tax=Marinobacterium halophilum TaxID=267374 RepID=A0A2P8EIT3_9GAMM|nr:esterase-like activity of phytase family protein [Marinobacterium halophilum]PSL09386.1 phytase-like protein with esterase activity [Marinobacterium halophilum]